MSWRFSAGIAASLTCAMTLPSAFIISGSSPVGPWTTVAIAEIEVAMEVEVTIGNVDCVNAGVGDAGLNVDVTGMVVVPRLTLVCAVCD